MPRTTRWPGWRPDAVAALRSAQRRDRRPGLAEARGSAGRAVLQAARRVLPDRLAVPGGRGPRRGVRQRRQSCAGRRLRLRPARRQGADLRAAAPRRGRSATGSSRSAATPSSWSSAVTPTTTASRWPQPTPQAPGGSRSRLSIDPDVIAGQGTVVREIVEQLGRAPDVSWCRSAAAGCWLGASVGWSSTRRGPG